MQLFFNLLICALYSALVLILSMYFFLREYEYIGLCYCIFCIALCYCSTWKDIRFSFFNNISIESQAFTFVLCSLQVTDNAQEQLINILRNCFSNPSFDVSYLLRESPFVYSNQGVKFQLFDLSRGKTSPEYVMLPSILSSRAEQIFLSFWNLPLCSILFFLDSGLTWRNSKLTLQCSSRYLQF